MILIAPSHPVRLRRDYPVKLQGAGEMRGRADSDWKSFPAAAQHTDFTSLQIRLRVLIHILLIMFQLFFTPLISLHCPSSTREVVEDYSCFLPGVIFLFVPFLLAAYVKVRQPSPLWLWGGRRCVLFYMWLPCLVPCYHRGFANVIQKRGCEVGRRLLT